jgi:hypothetical protein
MRIHVDHTLQEIVVVRQVLHVAREHHPHHEFADFLFVIIESLHYANQLLTTERFYFAKAGVRWEMYIVRRAAASIRVFHSANQPVLE